MKSQTKIEWTDATWNPLAGCSKVSAGCKNCYAIKDAVRLAGNPNRKIAEKYSGTTANGNWTGKINLASSDGLMQPLRWTRPRRIFVNSMSDLFHENVHDESIDSVFAVMAWCRQHTFQVLTKRSYRMWRYLTTAARHNSIELAADKLRPGEGHQSFGGKHVLPQLPLPNVHLYVSVEDQEMALDRIPDLLETPAAVRGISAEPLLSELDLTNFLYLRYEIGGARHMYNRLDHCIVGGESGRYARRCNVEWIRSAVKQCKAAHVPVFVKQLGANLSAEDEAILDLNGMAARHPKGGIPSEWPEDLRVRMFPGEMWK